MKKEYVAPVTENVNVKLFGSVLGGIYVVGGSPTTPIADGKENDILWGDDDSTSGDLWDDEENVEEY